MLKRWKMLPILGLVLLLVVSACGGTETSTPEPTAVPTATPAAAAPEEDPATSAPEGEVPDPDDPVEVVAPENPGTCEPAPLPELDVRAADGDDWAKGASAEDAEITIYEYSDFQCPGCSGMSPVLAEFLRINPNARLVYRHFPLDFHQHAQITAEASEAAGAQGKFWEMHDLLFQRVQNWSSLSEEEIRAELSSYADELDLDVDEFDQALANGTYADNVQADYDEARVLGLPGTPSFIFDNVLFPSDIGLSLDGLIAFSNILENKDELFFDAPPEMIVAEDGVYEARLTTSQGDIVVNLLPESAPVHVNAFVFLADENWYANSDFFFVRDNFVAVTGDPTNSSVGYPGFYCTGEEQGAFDRAGLLGMLANGQFFITLGTDASQLNGQFALIGQVVEGLDVLDHLTRRVVGDPTAPQADVLESVTVTQP